MLKVSDAIFDLAKEQIMLQELRLLLVERI